MDSSTTEKTGRRRAAFRLGLRAETLAAVFLQLKGYHVLARRFRCRSGEIDIVARRGKILVFVEVKARPSMEAGLLAVTARARGRIAAAARHWLSRNGAHTDCAWRFDMIIVRPWRLPAHVEGAFEQRGSSDR